MLVEIYNFRTKAFEVFSQFFFSEETVEIFNNELKLMNKYLHEIK